jgi:DNA-directed RNA polymerase subunit RPC12/RpoP
MSASAEVMLQDLRAKIANLATSNIGPGDIHPGLLSNINEAVQALRTGNDGRGKPVSPARVAEGLHKLVQYVSTPESFTIAGASVANDTTRVGMLRTYLFDLDQIAKVIDRSSDTPAQQPAGVDQQLVRDVTFSCPSCSQHIACDESYRGHQVQCPTCNAEILVPSSSPPPIPADASKTQEKEAFLLRSGVKTASSL